MFIKIKKIIKHPQKIINYIQWKLNKIGFFDSWNDEKYLKFIYKLKFKKKLNLEKPITFNEKLQWLKLNDRNDLYTDMVDKIKVKQIVSKKIGKEYIIPTIKTWKNPDEINFAELPSQFVLKCNHNSGGLVICKNKEQLDIEKCKKTLHNCLKRNYYYSGREWPYKNVKPLILAEEYIKDESLEDLKDYKFLCFNGKPKIVYLTVKNNNIWENFYDIDFNVLNIQHGKPRYHKEFTKPKNFDKMIEIAAKLSEGIPFIRIDLHNIDGKILFGEFTFYDWSGLEPFQNEKWDHELGNWIDLTKK